MGSIVDELLEKIRRQPSLIPRSGPRQDLGLLLFNDREALNALWKAADRATSDLEGDASAAVATEAGAELRRAVDRLRPLFGER